MPKKWFSFLERKDAGEQPAEVQEETGGKSAEVETSAGVEIEFVPLNLIDTNPYQPRQRFGERGLQELADSISQYGILQPVVVRNEGERYELIVGERRVRASRMAGLEKIPAVIRSAEGEELAFLALVENLQRQDLDFFEEAAAYEKLLSEFGLTQASLAGRIGKSQSTIANKLRLLKLPHEVKNAVRNGGLSERHARALLTVDCGGEQLRVVEEVTAKELSVRETEELVKERIKPEKQGSSGKRFVKVYKDVRLFLNSFRELVRNLREMGIGARFEQEEQEDEIVVRVRIPRYPTKE